MTVGFFPKDDSYTATTKPTCSGYQETTVSRIVRVKVHDIHQVEGYCKYSHCFQFFALTRIPPQGYTICNKDWKLVTCLHRFMWRSRAWLNNRQTSYTKSTPLSWNCVWKHHILWLSSRKAVQLLVWIASMWSVFRKVMIFRCQMPMSVTLDVVCKQREGSLTAHLHLFRL